MDQLSIQQLQSVLVVGGGVTGTSCTEALLAHAKLHDVKVDVTLLAAGTHVVLGRALAHSARAQEVSVHCIEGKEWAKTTGCRFIHDEACGLDCTSRRIHLRSGATLEYGMLCIATGATPIIPTELAAASDQLHVLRDTSSFYRLQRSLRTARDVVVVGNGGVALEAVNALQNVNITWIHRDSHEGAAFFDARSIGAILANSRGIKGKSDETDNTNHIIPKAVSSAGISAEKSVSEVKGAAHGPYWSAIGSFQGAVEGDTSMRHVPKAHVVSVTLEKLGRLGLSLSTGEKVECDLVICGTGVAPCISWLDKSRIEMKPGLHDTMGIAVEAGSMRTSVQNVFAAGDCTVVMPDNAGAKGRDWYQKYLWTQARSAGLAAGRSMAAEIAGIEPELGMEFELFAHATRFLNVPIVFLGRYSAQGLPDGYKMIESDEDVAESHGFARVVLHDGRIRGALLIGQGAVDRSETFEQLILDGLVVEQMGTALVDFSIDIEAVFD